MINLPDNWFLKFTTIVLLFAIAMGGIYEVRNSHQAPVVFVVNKFTGNITACVYDGK